MLSGGECPQCPHRVVLYRTRREPDGSTLGWWECDSVSCSTTFVPGDRPPWIAVAELEAELKRWRLRARVAESSIRVAARAIEQGGNDA